MFDSDEPDAATCMSGSYAIDLIGVRVGNVKRALAGRRRSHTYEVTE